MISPLKESRLSSIPAHVAAFGGAIPVTGELLTMAKAAIVILAGTESHADLGRVTNALQTAKEFVDEEDEVELIFDGAGTQWVAELEDEDHKYHSLYLSLEEYASVCEYCAGAFGVTDAAKSSDADLLDEYEGHPSLHSLVTEGYEIITF